MKTTLLILTATAFLIGCAKQDQNTYDSTATTNSTSTQHSDYSVPPTGGGGSPPATTNGTPATPPPPAGTNDTVARPDTLH